MNKSNTENNEKIDRMKRNDNKKSGKKLESSEKSSFVCHEGWRTGSTGNF